jgi:hypothetical protein
MRSLSGSIVYSYRHCRYHLPLPHSLQYGYRDILLSQSSAVAIQRYNCQLLRSPDVAILRCRNLLLSTIQYVVGISDLAAFAVALPMQRSPGRPRPYYHPSTKALGDLGNIQMED